MGLTPVVVGRTERETGMEIYHLFNTVQFSSLLVILELFDEQPPDTLNQRINQMLLNE